MSKQINKEWYTSKTVWAAAAGLVIAVTSAVLGETSPVVAVLIAVASTLGIYGRSKAQGPLV